MSGLKKTKKSFYLNHNQKKTRMIKMNQSKPKDHPQGMTTAYLTKMREIRIQTNLKALESLIKMNRSLTRMLETQTMTLMNLMQSNQMFQRLEQEESSPKQTKNSDQMKENSLKPSQMELNL